MTLPPILIGTPILVGTYSDRNAFRLEPILFGIHSVWSAFRCENRSSTLRSIWKWIRVEKYIEERTDAIFTHSLCEDRSGYVYPEFN
jgi:hypothetical protein